MRILMLCDSLGLGGAETHVVTLVRELLKLRADITVISAGGEYENTLITLGVRCIRAPLTRRDPISIFRALCIIKRQMRMCEVVHAHTRLTAYLARYARRKGFPKIVVTAHLDFSKRGLGRLSYFGDYTLSVSEDIKRHLTAEFGLDPKRIAITRNGIDLSTFSRGTEADGTPVISHVSRLDNDRADVAFLLAELAPELVRLYSGIKIIIAGDGERYGELCELADRINDKIGYRVIELLGGISDVENAVRGSTIFVGVSRAALEAMALGVPCVIAGNDGYGGVICKELITELIETNFCARGFQKCKNELLRNDIERLLDSKTLRQSVSDMQHELVSEVYSSASMARDAIMAYDAVRTSPKVFLLGYFGFGNIGDELTLKYCTEALNKRGVCDIRIAMGKAAGNQRSPREINRKSPIAILRALISCDILALGGGNLLQNESSNRSLLYYSAVVILARILGARVYFLGSGIGCISGKPYRLIARAAVMSADFIGARTSHDRQSFAMLGFKNPRLMPDLCFLAYDGTIKSSSEGEFVLFIAKGCEDDALDFAKALARKRGLPLTVTVLFKNSDAKAVGEICKRQNLPFIIPKDEADLISLIQKAFAVVSERLHGAILSLTQRRMTFISTDTEKNRALVSEAKKRAVCGVPIVLPATGNIKEVGAWHSDLDDALFDIINDINTSLDEIF